MVDRETRTLVRKHQGWMEGDTARFPSVYNKEQFEREWEYEATASSRREFPEGQ